MIDAGSNRANLQIVIALAVCNLCDGLSPFYHDFLISFAAVLIFENVIE